MWHPVRNLRLTPIFSGRIDRWTEASAALPAGQRYVLGYDGADELTSAELRDVSTGALQRAFAFSYDRAGNRLGVSEDGVLSPALANGSNQLTEAGGAGLLRVAGTVSEPSTVTVNGVAAPMLPGSLFWSARVPVLAGANTLTLAATETTQRLPSFGPQTTTRQAAVTIDAGPRRTLTYDLNGSMTADGAGRAFEWDGANRLSAIVHPPAAGQTISSGRTEFFYDGLNRWTRLVEKDGSGAITSDKRLVWDGFTLAEERSGATGATVAKRFFAHGVQDVAAAQSFFLTRDHLGSVREITDSAGALLTRYHYSLWGERTAEHVSGNVESDFGFTGHYAHARSGLHLAPFRSYDAKLGRWISRDPIAEDGGLNLYGYVGNDPTNAIDPDGLSTIRINGKTVLIDPTNQQVRDTVSGYGNGTIKCLEIIGHGGRNVQEFGRGSSARGMVWVPGITDMIRFNDDSSSFSNLIRSKMAVGGSISLGGCNTA